MSSEVTVLVLTPSTISGLGSADKARLDELGAKSGVAQKLRGPITSVALMSEERSSAESHKLYALTSGAPPSGIFCYVKTGVKNLWLYNDEQRKKGLQDCPKVTCVLDFYVDESVQRGGWGRRVFDAMVSDLSRSGGKAFEGLGGEEIAGRLAYDRPSEKMLPFLARHFGLTDIKEQSNNYLVFKGFWDAKC